MKKNKNIDDIFREKLQGYSPPPSPHIWKNVQSGINAQRIHKRRIVAGWFAAAAVVLLALVGGWYFSENSNPENQLANQSETVAPQESTTPLKTNTETAALEPVISEENVIAEPLTQTNKYNKPIQTVVTKTMNDKETNNNISNRAGFDFPQIASRKVQWTQKKPEIQTKYKKRKIEYADELTAGERRLIAENMKATNKSSEEDNSWKMGMFVSPGYSSHTANHADSYNRQMTYSDNSGNANISGGFSVQYKTSKRWSVESGMYYAQNGQKSAPSVQSLSFGPSYDMAVTPGDHFYGNAVRVDTEGMNMNAVRVENDGLHMNSTAGVIAFSENPQGAEMIGGFDELSYGKSNALVSSGEFSQVFNFVEIPLYARYRIIDSNFGVELMGGVNAGLVVGNNAYIDNEFGLQRIGETQDISTVNFSGTIGLGLNYALSKHFSVAVEPRLNYYINSINTNPEVDFRPYRIGIFTGLSYEF